MLSDEPELDAPIESDFLLRFLRVRKFNVDAALQTIRKYYRVRTECGSVFLDFLPSKVSPAARALITVMPEKDVYGRCILYINVGEWTPEMTFSEFQKALMICVEHLASDPVTQTLGVVLLLDYNGFTIDKMLGVSIGRLKEILEYFQGCIVNAALHLCCSVRPVKYPMGTIYAGGVLTLIASLLFLASLLSREKFKLHGENYEKLHEKIPPSVLPEKYGGTVPPLDCERFWRQLELKDELFIANNQYGIFLDDG
ncbi:hypothetical protein MRX96_026413 [Rhipicephalus microplus]